jgi:hypothetical protein
MAYGQVKGRRPFERASKIAHAEILNNPVVREFVQGCTLPAAPPGAQLDGLLQQLPSGDGRVTTIIAVDGGSTEVPVRKEFPSASIAFMTFGPLLLTLSDLKEVDQLPFIGPEDMVRFRNLERYNLTLPVKGVRAKGTTGFADGVRATVHQFLATTHPELMGGLRWLLFREWLPLAQRPSWEIPRCPYPSCESGPISLQSGTPGEVACQTCKRPVYLSDALRLYERIDEELGSSGIVSYLLTTLEQLVVVHLIKSVWQMKPQLLREILFVKDGPLSFFGVTAPLHRPMRALMEFFSTQDAGQPLINMVGLEKSGPFVEHAALIEPLLKPGDCLVLQNDYIYRYIQPGDPAEQSFGRNTYYGAKAIFKGPANDTYVATVPTGSYKRDPSFGDLFNGAEVLAVASSLRCSMYDNALVPIVLANRLVSLADVPSSEILARFSASSIKTA